jgi:hypothetical protein
MNKKKFLRGILPLAASALLLGGCSNDRFAIDETASGKQISFRLQGNLPVSRATGTTTGYVNAFVVNAQVHDNFDNILPVDGKMFDAQTVARIEGQANAFDYNPKRYYPDPARYAYYSAYSPVSKNVNAGFKGGTSNEIMYTVPAPDGVYGNTTQEDLLVAYTAVEGKVQPAGVAPISRAGFDSPVLLKFRHALSRVFVKASNSNGENVVIKKLSLNNLYSRGTLDIDDTNWNDGSLEDVSINEGYKSVSYTTDYKVLWKPVGDQDQSYEYVLPNSGISVAAGTANTPMDVVSKEQGMLILPQTTKNANADAVADTGDFYVEVTYSVSNIVDKTVKAAFKDINDLAAGFLTFEFGKQYALVIDFSGAAITFSISVEDWNDEENPAVAATNVLFSDNKPAEASNVVTPSGIADNICSKFFYNTDIAASTGEDVIGKNAPTLEGWTFQGYYDALAGGTRYFKLADDGSALELAGANGSFNGTDWDKAGPNQTLYAQWLPKSGDITIDAATNGGSAGSITTIPWTFDQRLPELDPTTLPYKDNYDFTGLFDESYLGNKIYDAAGHTSAVYNTSGQYSGTLYAQFTAKKFTVTIDLQGGTYKGKNTITFTQTYDAVAAFTVEPDKFSKSGKDFGGFSSSPGAPADVFKDEGGWTWQGDYGSSTNKWTATSEDITIYVSWVEP